MTRIGGNETSYYDGLNLELKLRDLPFHHQHNSRRSIAGWPDYTICAGDWLMFAEVKAMDGAPTAAQWAWLQRLLGPWRASVCVGVDALDELLRLADAMKAGRLDGAAGLGVLVLGTVRLPAGFDGGQLVGRGRLAERLAAGRIATRD